MEGSEKLTGQDKAVLGFIWISSFIYALLNDQVGRLQHHHRHHRHHQGDEQGGEPAVQRARGAQFQPCTCWSSLGPGKHPPLSTHLKDHLRLLPWCWVQWPPLWVASVVRSWPTLSTFHLSLLNQVRMVHRLVCVKKEQRHKKIEYI